MLFPLLELGIADCWSKGGDFGEAWGSCLPLEIISERRTSQSALVLLGELGMDAKRKSLVSRLGGFKPINWAYKQN